MARRVFFSFHFTRDSWRVAQVRNAWVLQGVRETQPLYLTDPTPWEQVKRSGDAAIKQWIDANMQGTSVTVVLIGAETARRRWVRYEIQQSISLGKGLLGVRIHSIKDQYGRTDPPGPDPFENIYIPDGLGQLLVPWERYPVYDWVWGEGRQNLPTWVEDAARRAGR